MFAHTVKIRPAEIVYVVAAVPDGSPAAGRVKFFVIPKRFVCYSAVKPQSRRYGDRCIVEGLSCGHRQSVRPELVFRERLAAEFKAMLIESLGGPMCGRN